jgi:hypothetical protein
MGFLLCCEFGKFIHIDCLWNLTFGVIKSNLFVKPYFNLCACMFFHVHDFVNLDGVGH